MSALRGLGGLFLLLSRTLAATAREGLSLRAVAVQLVSFGTRSIALVVTGMAFFGAVMVSIADDQARRFTGNVLVLGPPYFELLVREFGPLTVALLTASRAGAGAAAELASQAVNEQVEALTLSAGDPLSDWVAPRMVAGAVGLPLLAVIGTLTGGVAAWIFCVAALGIDGRAFIDPRLVGLDDLLSGLLKSVLCGAFIPLAAAWAGLAARGGAPEVGRATTLGVVTACTGCLVIDVLLSLAYGAAA